MRLERNGNGSAKSQNTAQADTPPFSDGSGSARGPVPSLAFGWAAASFAEQVPGLPAEEAERFDRDNAEIVRLHIRGALTDAERDRAIKRTHKAIVAALSRAGASS